MGWKLLHLGENVSAWLISVDTTIIISDKYLLTLSGSCFEVIPQINWFIW